MRETTEISFGKSAEKSLGAPPSEDVVSLVEMLELSTEAKGFLARMLALMKRSKYPARDLNLSLARWLSTVPRMLPGAWGGRIPPITLPGRHGKIDAYIAASNRFSVESQKLFVDIGCGFPPVTTVDTARKLKDWRIVGVDRWFAEYVLYDKHGNYACFDRDGGYRYFQASAILCGRGSCENPETAERYFKTLFRELFSCLESKGGGTGRVVEKGGNRLVRNHILDFETEALTFVESEVEALELPPVHAVRCMNVLLYFEPGHRKRFLKHAGDLLCRDGIMVAGTNGHGIQCRYAVFRKETNALAATEFAFGADNLGPVVFMPWYTIHENDPEAAFLAELAGAVRSDDDFARAFAGRVDELFRLNGICRRGLDGYLHFFRKDMPTDEFLDKYASVWLQIEKEGYPEGIVEVLGRAGYEAWKNPVGDVAVRPPADFLQGS